MNLFAAKDLDARSRIDWSPPSFPNLTCATEIYLDFETTGLRWWRDRPVGMALAWGNNESAYFPFGHRGGGNLSEEAVKRFAIDALRGKRIIGQNVKFDAHVAREWGVDLEALGCTLLDVSHCAALLDDNRREFNLDLLAHDFLGADRGKVKLTSFTQEPIDPSRMEHYHAGEIAAYAMEDVNLARDLWRAFKLRIEAEGLVDVLALECELLWAVAGMERNPPLVDVEKLERWDVETQDRLNGVLLQIHRETDVMLNPDSPKDWTALFEACRLQLPSVLTDSGAPSFAGDVLKPYEHPVIQLGIQAQNLKSLRDSYILLYKRQRDDDGHLRTNLHQLKADEGGTVSGRFSSTSFKLGGGVKVGANLQQVFAVAKQREKFGDDFIIRELFIPEFEKTGRRNGLWMSPDAAQIEYRLFAHYANNARVVAAYADNPQLSYHELVWEMVKPFKADIPYKSVKNLNFAKIYGAGAQKLALMLGLIRQEWINPKLKPHQQTDPRYIAGFAEAKRFVGIYEREIPEAKPLMDLASDTARVRGYVKTLLGRRGRFPGARRLHKALNTIIQGGAADIMKRKMIRAHKAVRSGEVAARLSLTVHDEFDGSTPNREEAAKLHVLLNEQDFDLRVPILWEMSVGADWADCENKSTKLPYPGFRKTA